MDGLISSTKRSETLGEARGIDRDSPVSTSRPSPCAPCPRPLPGSSRYARAVRHPIAVSIALASIVASLPGCLGHTYTIPKRELQALARTDPNARGQRVRVVQNFANDNGAPEAPRVYSHTSITVSTGVPEPGPVPRHGGGGSSIGGKTKAASASDDGAYWLVVASIVAVGLAVTEGARFDGWAELHPMHPVHLFGWDGSYTWMPLAHVTPEVAEWSRRAVVRTSEGPWRPLARAPLNRKGWTYAVLLGTSEVPLASGEPTRGFMGHIQFGHFFTGDVGLLVDVGLGWADDQLGNVVYDARNALELQYLPLDLGLLHGGVFGQAGIGRRLDDSAAGTDDIGYLAGGGALLQLELTTRLTITGRAGFAQAYGESISDLTLGLSIY
jgi:hypothetical protein